MRMAELFEVQGHPIFAGPDLPYRRPFGPAVLQAMHEADAEDGCIHGTNLRSAAGNGTHVVAIGHILLFVLAGCKVMGSDRETDMVAAFGGAFHAEPQETDTQESNIADFAETQS